MNRTTIEVGDLHADLWETFKIHCRHIHGPVDVTVGEHPDFGWCIVSHYGFENRIEWFTQRPIRA